LEDLGIDERIILRWILRKEWLGVHWYNLVEDRAQWEGFRENGNEHSGSIRGREFLV
jgi:hypothetical protein